MPASRHRERRWVFAPTDRPAAEALSVKTGVSPLLAQLLIQRDVTDPQQVKDFLVPDLKRLHDPLLLPGIAESAERIRQAVLRKERIVIYGDYDVDGVTATAILLGCIERAGGEAEYYLPHRQEEGYGLNPGAIRRLAEQGTRLLVTVDCGINALAEAELARELGMDLIVTDHHEPGPELPNALHVVNPHLPGSPYPFRRLAGAGVAFKLAWAIGQSLSPSDRVTPEFRAFLLDAVSLAALGSIADVVPLLDENRILASFGLRGIERSSRPGLCALRRVASLNTGPLRAWDVAFKLAPRLNAAGRLGCARRAVELLMTKDPDLAERLARELDRENRARRAIQDQMEQDARAMIEEAGGADGRLSVVQASESWNPGVVGIVAGRIAERLARPTALFAVADGVGRGSARSGGVANLFRAIERCADLLISYGGHEHAAGLRIEADKINAFRERFESALAEQVDLEGLTPTLGVDIETKLSGLSYAAVREVERLAPFGAGNESPVFASLGLRLASPPRRVGAGGKHLSFWATQEGVGARAIAFGMGDREIPDGPMDVIFQLQQNTYMGRTTLQMKVKDFRASE